MGCLLELFHGIFWTGKQKDYPEMYIEALSLTSTKLQHNVHQIFPICNVWCWKSALREQLQEQLFETITYRMNSQIWVPSTAQRIKTVPQRFLLQWWETLKMATTLFWQISITSFFISFRIVSVKKVHSLSSSFHGFWHQWQRFHHTFKRLIHQFFTVTFLVMRVSSFSA